MTVNDLAKQINFTLDQIIQICYKNNISVSEGTQILSEEDIKNLIIFLQNTPMISVGDYATEIEIDVDDLLD